MTARHRASSHSLIAALLLGLVLLGANYRLTLGLAAPKWDADMFFAPFQMLIADHARAGTFLLWDPWVAGGSPDYAEPQIGAFSPLAVAVGLVTGGTERSFQVYWLIIWLLGGLGVVCLGRHLGAPPWGRYVVALGFVFSGFYTGHAEHISTLYTISSLGFVIWRLDVALTRRALRPAVEAGVIWGLSALGGYPGWVFLNACFAVLWAAGRVWIARTEPTEQRATVRFAAVAVAALVLVGLIVLSPTYVAFLLEAPGYTDRSEPLTRDLAVRFNALHPGTLATFASPYLSTLKQVNPTLWEYTDLSTASVYLGPIVPVLAVFALVARPVDRWRWWLAALAAVFLLAALGQSVPLRGWLYDLVLPMRYFRHAGVLRVYPMFVLVVLALVATRDLALTDRRSISPLSTRFAVAAAAVSALAVGAYYAVMFIVEHRGPHATSSQLHLWFVWSAVTGIALALTRAPVETRKRLQRTFLIALATADAFFTVQFAQPTMYDNANARTIWNRVAAEHNPSLDLSLRGLQRDELAPAWLTAEGAPHNKNLPLKIATLRNYLALTNRYYGDLAQHPILSAMATGTNRIWFSRQAVAVRPSDEAYAAFVARSEALHGGVLVVHPRDLMTGGSGSSDGDPIADILRLPAATPLDVKVTAYLTDELSFEVTCPERGWLLVTDRWSRSWQATVNGKPVDVSGANFLFRAVPVEGGKNDVRFTYSAVGFPYLVVLSWSTIFATLAVGLHGAFRSRSAAFRYAPGRRTT